MESSRRYRRRVGIATGLLALLLAPAIAWGQQPAQRVLPRVTPPRNTPSASAPCLPHFDEELRLYVRPCQDFHADGPRQDWLDRMLVAVTWRSGAQFLTDLMPDERTHIAPYQRGTGDLTPTIAPERKAELLGALQAHASASAMTSATTNAAAKANPSLPPPADTGLAARKNAALGPENCSLRWSSADSDVPLTAPLTRLLEARAGEVVEVLVTSIEEASGYIAADPVLWLVQLDHRGEPEIGSALAVADGEPGQFPTLEVTAPSSGLYRLIVAPYRPELAGRITLEARVDGVLQARVDSAFFGGTVCRLSEVMPGDRLFAGATPAGEGHDAVLTLLAPPGMSGSSPYLSSNNDIGTLPSLTIPDGGSEHWLLTSAFDSDRMPTVDIYLSRVGAREGVTVDGDYDGLSQELEALLGSCDSAPRGGSPDCLAPEPLPPGWTAADTDNDGFTDFEEIHGIRRCYPGPATTPRNDVAGCLLDERKRCRSDCPDEAGLIAQIPLSALDGPQPTVHDIYIELDYWESKADGAIGGLPADQVALVKRTFEERFVHGDGTRPGTFEPARYPIAFHLFQDEPLRLPGLRGASHIPALAARSLFFDLFFTPDRKYTGTFHYVVGTHRGGGQSDVTGRAAIVGLSGGSGSSLKLAHEIGHLLGLLHNYALGNPDHTPFQLSIMSYGYVHSIPPPIVWDGTFLPCSQNNPCPEYFRCAEFPGHGQLCSPDCGVLVAADGDSTHYGRFSSGELTLPPESSEAGFVPEEGYPKWFLPYYYCYNNARRTNSLGARFRRFAGTGCPNERCVQCHGTSCSIDFDRDGDFDGLRGYDLDGNGKLNSRTLGDGDDHELLIARGAQGLRVLSKQTLAAFYTGFAGDNGGNFLPYPAITHEHHAGFVTDTTNRCDEVARWSHCRDEAHFEAALFRGPVAGDMAIEVRLPDDYCLPANKGLTLSLRVKPFEAPRKGYPVTLLVAGNLRLLLEGDAHELRWVAEYPGPRGPQRLVLADAGALGRWTRITLTIDSNPGEAALSLRRRTVRQVAEAEGADVPQRVCSMGIGAAPGEDSNFIGLLDDPMLLIGSVKTLR